MQNVCLTRQSDILVQHHLPNLTQLKKMGTQFFSHCWNCRSCILLHTWGCMQSWLCKLLSVTDLQSDLSRFKGHGMLAPFTAGWQSNDLHPLIIERSEVVTLEFLRYFDLYLLKCSIKLWEVKFRMLTILYTSFFSHWWTIFILTCYFCIQGSYVYDMNGNKYLDSLAGLWCTALGMHIWFWDNVTSFYVGPAFITSSSSLCLQVVVSLV